MVESKSLAAFIVIALGRGMQSFSFIPASSSNINKNMNLYDRTGKQIIALSYSCYKATQAPYVFAPEHQIFKIFNWRLTFLRLAHDYEQSFPKLAHTLAENVFIFFTLMNTALLTTPGAD